jgi:glycosyltransferase involved in cell wall biosynthesis
LEKDTVNLKLCYITGTYPPIKCGVADYSALLLEHLKIHERALQIEVITSTQANGSLIPSAANLKISNAIDQWHWSKLSLILAHLKAFEPDVIHYQYPTPLYGRRLLITLLPFIVTLWYVLKRRKKPAQLLTIHEYASFRLLGKLRIWLMALGCRKIIAVSPSTIYSLRQLKKLGKELVYIPIASNISATPPPAFLADKNKWLQEHKIAVDGRPVVAYFGYISPSKGVATLLKAFANLKQPAQLVMVAEAAPQNPNYQIFYDEIETLIQTLQLDQKIHWTGFATEQEVAAYLQSAAIVVLPYTDGASLRRTSLMAALVNGAPIISTLPDDLQEIEGLETNYNCLLVPPEDVRALTDALQQPLSDTALRSKLSLAALEFSRQFDWNHIAKKHLAVYENAL